MQERLGRRGLLSLGRRFFDLSRRFLPRFGFFFKRASAGDFNRVFLVVEVPEAGLLGALQRRVKRDLLDVRGVEGESPSDFDARGGVFEHGEGGVEGSPAVAVDDDTREDLDTFFVTFFDFIVDADDGTRAEVGYVGAELSLDNGTLEKNLVGHMRINIEVSGGQVVPVRGRASPDKGGRTRWL